MTTAWPELGGEPRADRACSSLAAPVRLRATCAVRACEGPLAGRNAGAHKTKTGDGQGQEGSSTPALAREVMVG
jgi:hypothetical protein